MNKRRFRWLGHVQRISKVRISKALLYSELVFGKLIVGQPRLRYKDVSNRDLNSFKNVDFDE